MSVDDAHWADAASLRFLTYLGRRIEDLPVAVLVASRPPEPGSEAEVLDALTTAPTVRRIAAAPLTISAATELLRAAFDACPDEEFARAFHRATGGNPFLATALIRTLREREIEPTKPAAASLDGLGPEQVRDSVLGTLRRLPPACAALARVVAVLGSAAELRRAAELAGLATAEAAEAADTLAAQAILRRGRPLEFAHPIVRSTVHGSIPHGERALAHAGAARECLRRALREPPAEAARPHVLRELGGAEHAVGDPAAVDHLRAALSSMRTPELRAAVARELIRELLPSGRFAEAVAVLEAAVDGLAEEHRELRLELEGELATAGRLDPSTRTSTAARLETVAERLGGRTAAERSILASLGFQRALCGGPAAAAAARAERALAGGLLAERGPDAPALADAMMCLIMAERFSRAERVLEETLAVARATSSPVGFAVASAFRSLLARRRGASIEAEGEARAAIAAAAETGWAALELMALAFMVDGLVDRGRPAAAREVLARQADGEIADHLMLDFLLFARARARLAADELEAAVGDLAELARRERAAGWASPARFPHRSEAALALVWLGEGEEARRLAAEEVELTRRWGTPAAIGVALRAAGPVTGSLELLREAAATLERSQARLEHARALVDLARRTSCECWALVRGGPR